MAKTVKPYAIRRKTVTDDGVLLDNQYHYVKIGDNGQVTSTGERMPTKGQVKNAIIDNENISIRHINSVYDVGLPLFKYTDWKFWATDETIKPTKGGK